MCCWTGYSNGVQNLFHHLFSLCWETGRSHALNFLYIWFCFVYVCISWIWCMTFPCGCVDTGPFSKRYHKFDFWSTSIWVLQKRNLPQDYWMTASAVSLALERSVSYSQLGYSVGLCKSHSDGSCCQCRWVTESAKWWSSFGIGNSGLNSLLRSGLLDLPKHNKMWTVFCLDTCYLVIGLVPQC